ncbi:MAG: Na+/H+ antiporter [Chloroflexi bacterium]|nr:Na+/H+ antiporter [Chloroflexota bacterium]
MEQFLSTETLVIELLLIVSLVAIAVRRLRIPYTVALVVVGLLMTTQQSLDLSLTPELILTLLVPPLVFESAFHINLRDLQHNLPGILLLTVPGVLITTLIVGGLVGLLTPLTWPLAFVFGALISATDPVAVVALFRALGAPKRLALLVEGESLFNDGTAIVVFNLVLAAALTGAFHPIAGIADFLRVSAGGLVVGLVLGWLIAQLIARIDDYLIETTLTTVLAFGTYLIAERLHFSGVLAVVAAGLINGNVGPQGMSPTTRIVLFNFWEYVAFLTNSLVFLLIGLQVNIPTLVANWQPVLWAILAVLAARAVVTYGLGWVSNRLTEPIPWRWLHVLNWGGLRGAIALALALSLPAALGPERNLVQVMAFGVVLFTLLIQSTTMKPLLRWLGIATRDPIRIEYETRHARMMAFRAAALHLDAMQRDGFLSEHAWEVLRPQLLARVEQMALNVRALQRVHPELAIEELENARRELLRAQRSALWSLQRDGAISEEVFERLVAEVDAGLAAETMTAPAQAVIQRQTAQPPDKASTPEH